MELELRIGGGDDPRLGPVGGLAAEHARLAVLARVAEGCVVQHLPGTETAIGSETGSRGHVETRLTFEVACKSDITDLTSDIIDLIGDKP